MFCNAILVVQETRLEFFRKEVAMILSRHKLRSCRKKAKKHPNYSNIAAYKEARRVYQSELRKTKREFFVNFCSNLDSKRACSRCRRRLKVTKTHFQRR